MVGRIVLIVVAIMVLTKAKSETVKGLAVGLAVSSATGFVKQIAGSINGFDGIDGLDGLGSDDVDGVGQIVQDENGMIYMVNGLGQYEPYYLPQIDGVNGEYEDAFAGVNGGIDEAIAARITSYNVCYTKLLRKAKLKYWILWWGVLSLL